MHIKTTGEQPPRNTKILTETTEKNKLEENNPPKINDVMKYNGKKMEQISETKKTDY